MIKLEKWKEIEGFPHYEVSNYGKVRSKDRYVKHPYGKRILKGKVLAGGLDKDGYKLVSLYYGDGGKATAKVHRLVSIAFIPNPEDKPQVNHKDGNKINNHVDNLEWATCSENVQHSFDTNLKQPSRRKKVAQIDLKTNEVIRVYESATQAARENNFNRGKICDCARGERNHHSGFNWEYI